MHIFAYRASFLRLTSFFHAVKTRAMYSTVVDPCILVDKIDKNIGVISKEDAHLLSNIHQGKLHRAFSVFLFSNDKKTLLMQKRADTKRTYPNLLSNSCCSHPQTNYPGEVVEENAIGVRRAASRRLSFELGLRQNILPAEDMTYITRIHYYSLNIPNDNLGEHEIDYILFGFADVPVDKPNPNEVSKCWYATPDELQTMLNKRPQDFTPWFRLIAERFLGQWWANIHYLEKIVDHEVLHDFCILKH